MFLQRNVVFTGVVVNRHCETEPRAGIVEDTDYRSRMLGRYGRDNPTFGAFMRSYNTADSHRNVKGINGLSSITTLTATLTAQDGRLSDTPVLILPPLAWRHASLHPRTIALSRLA